MSVQRLARRRRIVIAGLGAVAPVGLYPESVAAAAAAGVCRFELVESLRDKRGGEPLKLSRLACLPIAGSVVDRMRWLGARALASALAPLRAADPDDRARIAVVLSLPPERPGLTAKNVASLGRALIEETGLPVVRNLCGVYDRGHEGGLTALARAKELLDADRVDVCLVGGVDSYLDLAALDWLADSGRLKGDETPSGIVPGEGAGAVLLSSAGIAARLGLASRGQLVGVALATEPHPWYLGRATQGQGLTRALRGALAALPEKARADVTYCDMTGEPWRAEEWSFAYLRTVAQHGEPLELRHPGDAWGDVGAASAPLMLATVLVDLERGRVRGPRALLWCASDTRPFRGAALVEKEAS